MTLGAARAERAARVQGELAALLRGVIDKRRSLAPAARASLAALSVSEAALRHAVSMSPGHHTSPSFSASKFEPRWSTQLRFFHAPPFLFAGGAGEHVPRPRLH